MKSFEICQVIKNEKISRDIYEIWIKSENIAKNARPGQFLELFTGNNKNILPRPISICDIDEEALVVKIVYQVKGEGTRGFSHLKQDDTIKIMGPLGEGFKLENLRRIAVIGGGVGVPPLLFLSKEISRKFPDSEIDIFLGFREDLILEEEFRGLEANKNITTTFCSESGKSGKKGLVLDFVRGTGKKYEMIYSCGPNKMLQAVTEFSDNIDSLCQVSIEKRMACGLGACVGCVVKIKSGDGSIYKKACKDGPVFDGKDVIWDE